HPRQSVRSAVKTPLRFGQLDSQSLGSRADRNADFSLQWQVKTCAPIATRSPLNLTSQRRVQLLIIRAIRAIRGQNPSAVRAAGLAVPCEPCTSERRLQSAMAG